LGLDARPQDWKHLQLITFATSGRLGLSIMSRHSVPLDTVNNANFRPSEFDALDRSAGAAGSLGRIRQAEQDGRWRTRYLRAVHGTELVAAVPVHTSTGSAWPDPAYDPRNWDLPTDVAQPLSADRCLVVGNVYDRRSSLPARLDEPAGNIHDVLVAAARIAAADGRALIFPYVYDRARRALDAAVNGISWTVLAREARFPDVCDPDRPVGSRVRGVLRRDRRLIAAANLAGSVQTWTAAEPVAVKLIAEHNQRKGVPDHPEFVRARYQQWSECSDVELIVFSASAPAVTGVLTAMVWQEELELYEIGLPKSLDSTRIAVYLDLVFHRPLDYARERGLRHVRAGTEAETPKHSRGAVFVELSGGVLSSDRTNELADAD
jgi:hypothetical protein